MNIEDMNLIFVDVEATGASPSTGVMTQFGAVHYWTRKTFHGLLYDSKPDPTNPAKPVAGAALQPAAHVMGDFVRWLHPFPGRPIFVSDNNGYDFMWIADYFDRYHIDNPFGHSSRRISDFYAGLLGDFSKTQGWKKWRVTKHDHHPVHDALGNVEAFATMLEKLDQFQSGAFL